MAFAPRASGLDCYWMVVDGRKVLIIECPDGGAVKFSACEAMVIQESIEAEAKRLNITR